MSREKCSSCVLEQHTKVTFENIEAENFSFDARNLNERVRRRKSVARQRMLRHAS